MVEALMIKEILTTIGLLFLLLIPFYFIWNSLAPVYFSWLPKAYHSIPFWHLVGLFFLVPIVRLLLIDIDRAEK